MESTYPVFGSLFVQSSANFTLFVDSTFRYLTIFLLYICLSICHFVLKAIIMCRILVHCLVQIKKVHIITCVFWLVLILINLGINDSISIRRNIIQIQLFSIDVNQSTSMNEWVSKWMNEWTYIDYPTLKSVSSISIGSLPIHLSIKLPNPSTHSPMHPQWCGTGFSLFGILITFFNVSTMLWKLSLSFIKLSSRFA